MEKILDAVLTGSPPVLKGYSFFTDAMQQMVRQRTALIKDNWTSLEKLANAGLGQAYAAYSEISRSIGILPSQAEEANQAFLAFLKFHASKKETRLEFFMGMKQELMKKNPGISDSWLKALDALSEGKVTNNVILDELRKAVTVEPDMVNSAIEATVAQALRSLIALTHAGFNTHYKAVAKYPFAAHEGMLIPVFKAAIDEQEAAFEKAIKNLHMAVAHGEDAVPASCEVIMRLAEQNMPMFGRLQATLRRYLDTLKNTGPGKYAEDAGKLTAKAGDITRLAFAAYASAYYLSLQSRNDVQEDRIKEVLKKQKYSAAFPEGKYYKIAKITAAKKGDDVQTGGFVETINTRREGSSDKLISKVTLSDPGGNAKVDATGIFVHFRHVGLQEGAYCILNGSWQPASALNNNQPAIEIDKLSINVLAKGSWKLAFLDLSDKFFDRWPGGLNVSYGLSPHISRFKAGNESKILGAGELIFKPFIR